MSGVYASRGSMKTPTDAVCGLVKKLKLEDSRRLTGANLFWDMPAAIIDVAIEGPAEAVIRAWKSAVVEWLDAVGALPVDPNRDCTPIAATLMAIIV